ncbi:hypothetical protein BD779DRAFT_1800370 [Infundibulicybe gibba]|nr:hypothetical protein BD779DRAFT_1800370 [Infundibulicybe gibba]
MFTAIGTITAVSPSKLEAEFVGDGVVHKCVIEFGPSISELLSSNEATVTFTNFDELNPVWYPFCGEVGTISLVFSSGMKITGALTKPIPSEIKIEGVGNWSEVWDPKPAEELKEVESCRRTRSNAPRVWV